MAIPGCCYKQVRKKPIAKQITLHSTHSKPLPAPISLQTPPVTIWVHGTRLLPKGVLPTFFYSKPGLHHYQEIDPKYYQHKIAQTLINADPINYPEQEFYLFGWSGKLSFDQRKEAAAMLYHDLKELQTTYKKRYGQEPYIRIISHSHGGNVILLLEEVKDADDNLVINEVIFLAVPVQTPTMEYVCAPIFKKIYSLYSLLDVLQIIDPQGLQQEKKSPLFSKRAFECQEKIEQVAIKMNERSIMHIEFIKPQFLSVLPSIITEIDQWRMHCAHCPHEWVQQEKYLCIKIRK